MNIAGATLTNDISTGGNYDAGITNTGKISMTSGEINTKATAIYNSSSNASALTVSGGTIIGSTAGIY